MTLIAPRSTASLPTTSLQTPDALSPTSPAVAIASAPRPAAISAAGLAAARPDLVAEQPPAPRIRAVPAGTEARGFVLYVGFGEELAEAAGTSLGAVVEQLKALTASIAPGSQTYAAVALAPEGSGGRDVDVVRLALQDPAAVAKHRTEVEDAPALGQNQDRARDGVVIDLSRKRVTLDNEVAPLTYTEYELLQFLVLREGRTVERHELIQTLWSGPEHEDAPNERTIDVHIRRLRGKLGTYEDIVRTVRGAGYRFDRHADVSIRHASTPSPDVF